MSNISLGKEKKTTAKMWPERVLTPKSVLQDYFFLSLFLF